jgi:hypothetical protein
MGLKLKPAITQPKVQEQVPQLPLTMASASVVPAVMKCLSVLITDNFEMWSLVGSRALQRAPTTEIVIISFGKKADDGATEVKSTT